MATAETRWAFVDYATNQPTRIPREIAEAFVVVAGKEGKAQAPVVAAARESIMACEWAKVARQHYDQVYKPLLSTVRP